MLRRSLPITWLFWKESVNLELGLKSLFPPHSCGMGCLCENQKHPIVSIKQFGLLEIWDVWEVGRGLSPKPFRGWLSP